MTDFFVATAFRPRIQPGVGNDLIPSQILKVGQWYWTEGVGSTNLLDCKIILLNKSLVIYGTIVLTIYLNL